MKSRFLLLWLILIAAFNFLFWHEAPGLNMLLFAVLVMTALFIRYPRSLRRKSVQLTGSCTLLCGVMVTIYGPGWSVFAVIFSLSVFTIFVMEPQFRSVSGAAIQFVLNVFSWMFAKENGAQTNPGNKPAGRGWFYTKVLLLPLLVTFLFFVLYLWGNPHFAEKFGGFFTNLIKFFEDFTAAHFFFLLGGTILCGAFLRLCRIGLERLEQLPDEMVRKKRKHIFPAGMIALRSEVKTGIVMLALLNVLLLFVNGLDISKVWYRFVVPKDFSLKDFVHEGTWVLMFSIFLSMAVLLWLFRGNIHFYKKNLWLKRLAYIWIAQNVFLALSLFKRNYEYIDFHGLAYGRIVVIVFLIVVIAGLITFVIKIKKDRSVFFLNRINSWIAYFLIVMVSFVNWDMVIVRYNLHHWNKGQIDTDFYLHANEDVYPLLFENEELVYQQLEAQRQNPVVWVDHLDDFWKVLHRKRFNYWQANCCVNDWKSWHYLRDKTLDWMDIH